MSSKPMMLSKVLLPQPEGPMIERNSPLAIWRFILLSARVSIVSVRYTFSTFCKQIIASFLSFIAKAVFIIGCENCIIDVCFNMVNDCLLYSVVNYLLFYSNNLFINNFFSLF